MIENASPTGGTDPKVTVVEPLNKQPVSQEEIPPPLVNIKVVEQIANEETPPPLVPQEEETPPPLTPQDNQRTASGQFDFGTIVIAQKDATAKINKKKTPEELFQKPIASENTTVREYADIERGVINESHNTPLSPNTGTVKLSDTGAPVIHKEGDLKALKYSQFPADIYISPDILRTVTNFRDAESAIGFLNAGKIPTLSSMDENTKTAFANFVGADNMPTEKMSYPEVNTTNLDSVFNEVNGTDKLLQSNLLQSQDEIASLQKNISEYTLSLNEQYKNESSELLEQIKHKKEEIDKLNEEGKSSKTNEQYHSYQLKFSLLQKEFEDISKAIKSFDSKKEPKELKDYKLKWEDLTSKNAYFNIWKSVIGDGKKEIYPEEVTSKVQELRNNQKYDLLKKYGFVSEVPSDVPENIQNFLKSSEYINSTAKQKMLYAKMMWRTNMDKYPTPQDLYTKISKTFTPSVSLLFLKQKAKDNLKGINLFQLTRESNLSPTGASAGKIEEYATQARELYSKLIDADFENDNNALQAIGYMAKHHGSDVIPFLSGAFKLGDSINIYSVVNKASKNGVESLSKEDKILFDAYSMFNSYTQLSQPDHVTQAINAIPGLLSFIGELGIGGVPAKALEGATSKFIRAGASQAMKTAIEKSPSIIGSSVEILKALNGVTGGSLTKFAGNASGLASFPLKVLNTTLMARALEVTGSAINMTTNTPTLSFDEDRMRYIGEILPTDRPEFWANLQTSLLLESANVGTIEAGKVIGEVQNDAIIKLMSKFDKASPVRKLLNLLKANQLEGIAAEKGLPTGIEAFMQRAKSLNPATVVPDMVAFGALLPRAEHKILGTKDGFWDNPVATLKDDMQNAAIGLAAPVLGGKLIGLASLSNFGRVIFRNEAKFADFQNKIFSASKEDFMSQEFQDNLRNDINYFAKTGSVEKDRFGKLMQARLEHRLAFEEGKIEGAIGETYSEYIENARNSQRNMDALLEQVRDGSVDKGFIEDAISSAADAIDRRQFEFHRDLINGYETSGKETETLKDYVDKHKKVYFDIKGEFAALHSLRTAPDWTMFERRINEAMLPSDYKNELKATYDALKTDWEADTQRIYGQNVQSRTELPEMMSVGNDTNKHTFLKKGDGTYKFVSGNEAEAATDISFRLNSMAIPDVLNLYEVSRNSDMAGDIKEQVARSIKERAISEFENNEFFSDFGGRENMSQLLDAINTVAQTSPLTSAEKNALTNAVQNVFEVEIRRESNLDNYVNVKSAIQRLIQNSQIVDIKNVLDFHKKMSGLVMKQAIKDMTNSQLEYEIQTSNGDSKELLREEVNERKNLQQATGDELKKLLTALNLQSLNTNVDFEALQRNNPTVKKISQQVFELQKLGVISEKGRNTIEGILCAINPEFLNVKDFKIKKTEKGEASRYLDKSRTIVVTYHDGMTESQVIAEMTEEILHSVEHNLATSLGNGGLIGDFLLTDKQIEDICGTNRTDAVANIARWYKSKDYDYNRFLQLKDKLPSEMTEAEKKEFYQIKDMLLRFGTKYGQKWDNLKFIDKENNLNWEFTTESLVRNWNRYNQMKTLSRPDGRRYSSAEAFYYSAYSHEYFARTLGDYQISDVSNRISGDVPIDGMISKASNFISKVFKLPVLTKLFRSETFEGNNKKLRDMMSPADENNLLQMVETKGEALNSEMKADFDNILSQMYVPGVLFRGEGSGVKDNTTFKWITPDKEHAQFFEDLKTYPEDGLREASKYFFNGRILDIRNYFKPNHSVSDIPDILESSGLDISNAEKQRLSELFKKSYSLGYNEGMELISSIVRRNGYDAILQYDSMDYGKSKAEAVLVVNKEILKNIEKDDLSQYIEHYRNLQNNPQGLSDFILSISDNAKRLGYDASITNDIVSYLNKEIAITGKEVEAFRDEEERELRYVSNTMKALEGLKIEKTSGANWLDKILSSGGKKVEIERYGLDEFLKSGKSFSKQDLIDFLSDKVMKVKDIVLGGEIDIEKAKKFKLFEDYKNELRGLYDVHSEILFNEDGEPYVNFFVSRYKPEFIESGTPIHEATSNDYVVTNITDKNIEELFGVNSEAVSRRIKRYKELHEELGGADVLYDPDTGEPKTDILDIKETRWSEYTSFPLNNYRELLPVIDTEQKLFSHKSHFSGIKNQLYHNRLNDVVSESGKRLLLSEEMQGDWTQAKTLDISKVEVDYEYWKKELAYFTEKEKELNTIPKSDSFSDKAMSETFGALNEKRRKEAEEKVAELEKQIPSARLEILNKKSPYANTSDWVRAAIKRMIKMAVDEGKDGIAWTPAHIQVERWSTATRAVVDRITYKFIKGKQYDSIAVETWKDGSIKNTMKFYFDENGAYERGGERIEDIFGKEISKQIIDGAISREKELEESGGANTVTNIEYFDGEITGDNIMVGGQGYKDIYDKTAVDVANKLVKKYGLEVTKEKVKSNLEANDEFIPEPIEVHSLIFNDKMKEDVKKQSEMEIFAKREEEKTAPYPSDEFKNISDLVDNSLKLAREKEIQAYRGIEGLNNLERTNPEEYKRLHALLDEAKTKFTNPDDKSYYINNYLANGWFREKLKGTDFYKSKIDDSKMTILSKMPVYKAPSTSRLFEDVMRYINGNKDSISKEVAKSDTDVLQNNNVYLDDIVSHKELFESYPELRNSKVEFYWGDNDTYGFHYEQNNETRFALNVNKIASLENPMKELKDTLMHEVQHKIQEIEGFHRGTSEEYFKDNFFVYNVYQAKERGDAYVIEQLEKPENAQLASLVNKIGEGKELAPKEFQPKDFMTAKSFADSRIQILSYMKSIPEYRWAYDMYRRGIGEIEAFDVEQNKESLPATLLLSLGESIRQQGYDQLIKPQDIIPILEKENAVEAKRDDKYLNSPVDVSWFQSLFEDKNAIVGTRDIERVIKDVDDNISSFLGGDIKNLPQAKRAASSFAHGLIELWKNRMIAKSLPKSSVYERKEIARLVNIPFRKKLQDYTKDIAYIQNVVENANFRKLIAETKREQIYARNRFLRYNKDDVNFYSAVNKLTSINTRMFETIDALNKYNELLTSKPSDVNVEEFKNKVNDTWNEYLDWKKQFNDQYTGGEESVSEDESILNEQLFYDKKQIVKEAVKIQLVNRGLTELDRNYVDAFARVDVDAMDANELKEYEAALKYLLLNPETINHKVVKLVNKYQAQGWYEKASEELSRKYIDEINRKSLPSTNALTEYAKGLFPGIGKDKLGNISAYNVKSLLEIAEGMSNSLPGVLQSEITEPINRDYQQFLINKADAIRKISAKEKYSISEMHRVGIKALLDQKPQFSLTANALKVLSENGINIEDMAVGEVISSKNTEPDKIAAYKYILGQSNQMIKESILISFGVKPDESWTDNEMKEILGDVSVMSRRNEAAIKEELDNLLNDSGYTDLASLVNDIESGTHNLSESENSYLEKIRETMNEVKDGKYSRGMDLKGASEKLYGIEFQEIENYFPLLRYKTYLTTEKYLDPEHNEDANYAKVFYGIYNDFQMNTQFLEKRKPTVMALQTNAYEAVAKRLDQQIFYLNHVEHQNYLKSLFRTNAFYGKGDMFNTEATNQIVDLLNGNYNRGVNEARAEIMKDVSANFIYNAVQRYKALYVGDWLKSPGQLSTVIFNMAKMKGNALKKVKDVGTGSKMMVNSYIEGSDENLFLSKYAPEVYYRGLNTYDFVGLDSGENYTEGTGGNSFSSEAARNSGKVSGVARGLERGLYRTNKSRAGVIASEIKNPYSQFGAEWNLAGLKFHDRVAARTSFFSSYKNYCDYLGVDASLTNPNELAVNKALEDVRETQFTDNPLQRSGISYNLIAGGSKQFPGDWTMINLLAFKSFSINERQTLMKASERLKNAVYEKKWDEASNEASYFAYSFASKMAFNYIKLVCQKYILTAASAAILSDDESQRSALIKESIGTSAQLSNVALHSFLDYFTLAEPVKWGATIGLKFLEEKAKGELSPEDKQKYRGSELLNQDMLSGFTDDVAKNIVTNTSEAIESNKDYGVLSPETLRDDASFFLLLSQMRYGLPGASIGNNLLREMNKQKKFMERSKGTSEDSLYK